MKKTLVAPSALVNNNDIIQPAVIEINNDIITKISNHIPKKTDNLIKLDDTVLLPGLTNAHAHLELTGIGPLKEHGFVSWIKELIKAKTRQTPTDVVDSLHKGSQLLLSSGVTTTIDHISFDSPIAAYKKLSGTFIGFGEVVGSIEPISRMIYERLQDLQRASPIELNLTLHAIQTVNENIIREFLKNDEPPFSVHLCEYGEEQEYFQNNTGPFYDYVVERFPELKGLNRHQAPSAIQYLDKHNEALHHSLIIHANYIDAADIAILNKWQNICVVHCPGSFAFFQHDQFPFEQYKINNIKMALGTDGLVCNEQLNYLREIQLFLDRFPQISLTELMPMITTNALEAIGVTKRGLIKEGYFADIIGFNYHKQLDIRETLSQAEKVCFCMTNGLPQQGL